MIRRLTTLLGACAAVMGGLMIARSHSYLWKLQMGLMEIPWLAGLTGLFALTTGWGQRNRAGVVLGGWGLAAALGPLLWLFPTLIRMEEAMQRGLGDDYPLAIPQRMWPRLARVHWSPLNSLGWRSHRTTAGEERDIVYAQPGVRPLKLDIYRPQIPPAAGNLYPAIITLHPGGWRDYDKGGRFSPHHRYLASQGYVMFDVQYRLSQEASWPAPLQDVQAALRWVRDHADAYQVNPNAIALMGRSAGGQLALRAAYDPEANVQAVIALYAPTDMRLWDTTRDNAVTELLNGSVADNAPSYADASPVEWVREDLPPTLLIHGLADTIVPSNHTELLSNHLRITHNTAVTLYLPWSRHTFDALISGLGAQVAQYNIDRFLAWSLFR